MAQVQRARDLLNRLAYGVRMPRANAAGPDAVQKRALRDLLDQHATADNRLGLQDIITILRNDLRLAEQGNLDYAFYLAEDNWTPEVLEKRRLQVRLLSELFSRAISCMALNSAWTPRDLSIALIIQACLIWQGSALAGASSGSWWPASCPLWSAL